MRHMTSGCKYVLVAFAILVLPPSAARATILASHAGSANPETEGWTHGGSSATDAAGTDTEAHWSVMAAAGTNSYYTFIPTAAQLTDPAGWTMTARVRPVASSSTNFTNAWFYVVDGSDRWGIGFSDGTGTPTKGVYTGRASGGDLLLTNTIDPFAAYHVYQLIYNPSNSRVTFYIDGVSYGSQTRTQAVNDTDPRVRWGDTTSGGLASESHWSLVTFETGQKLYHVNDLCANATPIGLGAITDTTACADPDGTSSCADTGTSPDIWYLHTPAASGTLNIDTCGSTLDTVVSVFDACGGSELASGCNDNCSGTPCGGPSSCLSVSVMAGAPVLIRVAGAGGASGSFVLNLSMGAPPANDLCANAMPVTEGTTDGTSVGSGIDGSASCSGANTPDVWYAYTPTMAGTLTADVCGASFAAGLSVHNGCPGSTANQLACSAACPAHACDSTGACLTMTVHPHQTYYVRVFGLNGQRGTFSLNLTLASNDTCAAPVTITDGSYPVSTTAATNDTAGSCGNSDSSPDAWYRYTATCHGQATISLCSPNYDAVLSIYPGAACPATPGTELACNDNCDGTPCGGPGSCLSVPVIAGDTLLIRVAGANGASGDATLAVACQADPPPANDDCANAQAIGEGLVSGKTLNATPDGNAACGAAGTADVWYTFTPAESGWLKVLATGTTAYPAPFTFSVHTACPGTTENQLHCETAADLLTPVSAGATYYIRVADTGNINGLFTLMVKITPSALIATHSGPTNPATEGWSPNSSNPAVIVGPGRDEEDYWGISTPIAASFRYHLATGANFYTDPTGWTMSARMKVPAASSSGQAKIQVIDGKDLWELWFSDGVESFAKGVWIRTTDGSGNLQLSTTDPTSAYHTYQIVFDPAGDGGNGSVTYYEDGFLIGTQTRADAVNDTLLRVSWGDATSTGALPAEMRFAFAQFELGQHVITDCHDPFADADGDQDVDLADFGVFQACFTGNTVVPLLGKCRCMDLDEDTLVDGDDLTAFLACVSGPTILANPNCD